MSAYDVVKAVKRNLKIESDAKVAEQLGVNKMNVSNWKNKGQSPDAETAFLMADLAGVTPKEALRLLQHGYANVSLLLVTALTSTLALALFVKPLHCILC